MLTVDELERLARFRAGELSDAEADEVRALLTRPEYAEALAQLEALDRATQALPLDELSHADRRRLTAGALEAKRPPRFHPALAVAAGLLLLFGGFALSRFFPEHHRTVLAATEGVSINGVALPAGQSLEVADGVVTTSGTGVAEVRLDELTALVAPSSALTLGARPQVERGAVAFKGTGVAGGWKYDFLISGHVVLSREPLQGDFRVTGELTPEALLNPTVLRYAGVTLAGGLAVYILQGSATQLGPNGAKGLTFAGPQMIFQGPGDSTAMSAAAVEGAPPFGVDDPEDGLAVTVTTAGQPVAGASVRAYRRGPLDTSTGEDTWSAPREGDTDGTGAVRLSAGAGVWVLVVRAPGLGLSWVSVTRPPGEAVTPVAVALEAGFKLVGHTEDARTHQPVVPASLTLSQREWPPAEALTATVDARGRFAFDGLAAGTWVLSGEAPGSGRATPQPFDVPTEEPVRLSFRASGFVEGKVRLPNGAAASGAEVLLIGEDTVAVTASAWGAFAAELPPGEWTVQAQRGQVAGRASSPVHVRSGETSSVTVDLVRRAVLSGRVTANGAPVFGARVRLSPYRGLGDLGSATSDARGQYELPLAPGLYDVEVVTAEFAPEELFGLQVSGPNDTVVDFALSANGSVEGVVRDETGHPVEGLVVTLTSPAGGTQLVRLGADGHYRAPSLRPGAWDISVKRAGEVGGASARIDIRKGETSQADFVLHPSGVVKGRVEWRCPGPPRSVRVFFRSSLLSPKGSVQLAPGEMHFSARLPAADWRVFAETDVPDCETGEEQKVVQVKAGKSTSVTLQLGLMKSFLEVRVIDVDGSPVEGAVVMLLGPDGIEMLGLGDTDVDGTWNANKALPPAAFSVRATKAGRSAVVANVAPRTQRVTVQLQPAASLDVKLSGNRPGVRSTVGFALFPDFAFEEGLVTTSNQLTAESVPTGRLRVIARSGDLVGSAEVQTLPGKRAEVSIALAPGGTVSGRLVDESGAPSAGFVSLMTASGAESTGAMIDHTGRFRLSPIVPGTYRLLLYRAEGEDALPQRELVVTPGAVLELGDVRPPLPAPPEDKP